MENLGKRIYDLRKGLGLTLEDVGRAVGVGKSTVRKWEQGTIANMRRDKIKDLASVLCTTPAYIMGWTDEPYLYDEKKPAPVSGDGLSPLDVQLMDLLRYLTDDQKKFLLAQIKTLRENQE